MKRSGFGRAAALAIVAVLIAAAPAAATTTVKMHDGNSFSPHTTTISPGTQVKWQNDAFVVDHDVFGDKPSSYISNPGGPGGLHPGDSFSRLFDSAGTFPYLCRVHAGMSGTVIVGMTVQKLGSGSSTKFKITVGSDKLSVSSPFRRVVQVDVPGGGSSFVDWKTTGNASVTYVPSAGGTYQFRSYVVRLSDNTKSRVSPVLSVTK